MRFEIINHNRVLARTLVYSGCVRKLALADLTGKHLAVSDFDMESANTVFADGIVLCMVARACDPSVFPETVAEALSSIKDVNASAVCALLTSKNALASDCDASADVMLVNIK